MNNRPLGTLPSDTEINPGRNEHCKAVTLRSGKDLQETVKDKEKGDNATVEIEEVVETGKDKDEL